MTRLGRLLATLALLGQVLAGALVVPDDARAAALAAIDAAATHCGTPATSGPHGKLPTRRDAPCALSLTLAPHAALLAQPSFVPLPLFTVRTANVLRPPARAPPLRTLGAFPPPRGPPARF